NLPQLEEDLNKALILRHYGDGKGELNERRRKTSVPLVNGLPQKPEVNLPNPDQQKLHYGINDGSSFIYYPSGCMAVCQSRSGLPCGGFYTNVFSDGQRPVTLVTITPFGYGAVTHPLSFVEKATKCCEGSAEASAESAKRCIKCPDAEHLLWGQLGTQPRRAAQSAALPALNSPERKEAALLHGGRSRKDELRESHRCLSASPEKPQDRLVQIQRC
ncbi:hypothetical protein XENOCAPTIV_010443, partial [Xenoophorus captivus]